jgi:hypothetical protein
MAFICRNCGVRAHNSGNLCRPSTEQLDEKFCGFNALQVCDQKRSAMKFKCDACLSVSAEPHNLCSPRKIDRS